MWKSWFQNQLPWWLWLSRYSSIDFASDKWEWWDSVWYWTQMCKYCEFPEIKFRNFLWWGNIHDLWVIWPISYEPYDMRWFINYAYYMLKTVFRTEMVSTMKTNWANQLSPRQVSKLFPFSHRLSTRIDRTFLKILSRNVKNLSTGNQLGHSTVAMENKFLHVDSILLMTFYQAGFK